MAINEVKIIGLTGMSGAGKTTACAIFEKEGFEIIDCDVICREIVEKGKPCLNEIVNAFGKEILNSDGTLCRRKMGKIVFTQKDKRESLNGIMYPYVSYIVIKRVLSAKNRFVIIDAPTLFESGTDGLCDIVVSIVAERESLIDRIAERDGIDRNMAESRLDSQHNADFFIENSDYVIQNNNNVEEFTRSVLKTAYSIKEDK